MAKLNWQQKLKEECPVFYFYSAQEYLARRQAQQILAVLEKEDPEITQLDGPAPSIEEVIACAGTISFFGTRRVVYIPGLAPSSYSDKDLAELCDVLSQAENAVFILTSVFADKKAAGGKRVKTLIDHCSKIGFAQELLVPTEKELCRMLQEQAAELGAKLESSVAMSLLERCGQDQFLLENEVNKLAAVAAYGEITAQMVEEAATQNLEADVFAMTRLIAAKNAYGACNLLHKLLLLREDPIKITAALAGSYQDYYRIQAGKTTGKPYQAVHKDFHYTGSDYRLKKAADAGRNFSREQLKESLQILQELDEGLKRSPVSAQIQMETALCRLVNVVKQRGR